MIQENVGMSILGRVASKEAFVQLRRFLNQGFPNQDTDPNGHIRSTVPAGWNFRTFSEGCLIVKEERPKKSMEIFLKHVSHGFPGFIISREYPEKLKRQFPLNGIHAVWLSRTGTDNSISPDELWELKCAVEHFSKKSRNSVIFLSGLEYLIVQTDFETILNFLDELEVIISANNSRLIMPFHEGTLSADEYAMLEEKGKVV